jgi:phosphatidylserine/phosphatidylglycerophosphate/cardiolipin synthase-like enzyme
MTSPQGTDLSAYISVLGLRTWAVLDDVIVTEQVYVHSKLVLVDDVSMVVGSPNLNDRSLLGIRDSEVAVLMRDTSFVDSTMDGAPYRAGRCVPRSHTIPTLPPLSPSPVGCGIEFGTVCRRRFARDLRLTLWREHMGLGPDDMRYAYPPPTSLCRCSPSRYISAKNGALAFLPPIGACPST